MRTLKPEEILSEEEVCARRHPLFPLPWETAVTELSGRYSRTRARLQQVLVGSLVSQSLLVQTPLG